MMRQYELVERVANYIKNPDEALLNKAYVYAMQKHGKQKRASGDPYFSHPLEVAAILTDLHLDEETIAVALLHDTIEDTDATRREIDEEIRRIVDECYATAERILEENMDKLHAMAEALIKYETIDSEQIQNIMAGKDAGDPSDWDDEGGSPVEASAAPEEKKSDSSDSAGPIGGPAGEH